MVLQTIIMNGNITRSAKNLIMKASICHKSKLPDEKVYAWPYNTVPYNFFTMWYDLFSKKKFNQNSVIVQIEGNFASGKERVGRRLAEELGMKYYPQPDLESIYFNSYGFDYRSLNPQLPERLRACDWKMFHENPARHSVIHLLHYMQALRFIQYLEATVHVFNTGQGAILQRSCFTEKVIIDAMHNLGWLPRGHVRPDGMRFYDWRIRHEAIRSMVCYALLAPHLTIYLDVPPEECKKRLDASPDPITSNSKFYTLPLLEEIEKCYKTDVLKRAEYYGRVLTYDHSRDMDDHDISAIVHDIEATDFGEFALQTQFATWRPTEKIGYYNMMRRSMGSANKLCRYLEMMDQPDYDIAGLGDSITYSDLTLKRGLLEHHVVGWKLYKEEDPKYTPYWKRLINRQKIFDDLRRAAISDFE